MSLLPLQPLIHQHQQHPSLPEPPALIMERHPHMAVRPPRDGVSLAISSPTAPASGITLTTPSLLGGSSDSMEDEQQTTGKKRKRFNKFRHVRAHCNPLADNRFPGTPVTPNDLKWEQIYPGMRNTNANVEFADVGCGFGGLLVSLAPLYPNTLMLGLEIRDRAVEYVNDRIHALRVQHQTFSALPASSIEERMEAYRASRGQQRIDGDPTFHYANIHAMRCNAMKYFPCYFRKGQLTKLFFLFPDPHFKKTNHRRRIITPALLAEYAYGLAIGGILYTITDVHDLHLWMAKHLDEHPLFQRLSPAELQDDKAFAVIFSGTDEGLKVDRAQGSKYPAVYRRVIGPRGGCSTEELAHSLTSMV